MNVRPNSPETGILQFAGGQSGHFLSPHYSDQLSDWADGTPTPFLAGPTEHSYTLSPVR
jgi:penicillin amidase